LLNRKSVKISDTWDLNFFYKSITDWEKDLEELKADIPKLNEKKGSLAKSIENFDSTARLYLDLRRRSEKILSYALMLCDQDLSNQESLKLKETAMSVYSMLSQSSSFLRPEILEIENIDAYLNDPKISDLKRTITELLRYKPHTLSAKEEALLALGTEYFSSTSNIFSQLNNTDLKFEPVEGAGPLSHGTYLLMLRNKDREIRKKAFQNYYNEFDDHKNTIAAIYSSSVKKNIYFANAKNFNSALEQSLFADNVSKKVYLTLIDSVSDNLVNLHEYYAYRAEKLNLEQICMYDTYTSLVENSNYEFSFGKASQHIINAVAPLGEEYQKNLAEGLTTKRWVDKYENKGKRSGAYCSGCYDSTPYILMNYQEKGLESMFTLAHEAGHAMHSFFSNRTQKYQDHQYTIFVAEVASTVNELLLSNYLLTTFKDDELMQKTLSNHLLDDIKSTFYRQTMFAEFELKVHSEAEQKKPIGLEFYRKTYKELLQKYFGKNVIIGEKDDLECLRIPHFYSAFYVYKYATGISAAINISQRILAGDKKAIENYLSFLSAGGSKQPLDLLRDAGVDLEQKASLDLTSKVFKEGLAKFKSLT
jgi:oligoendopeptidase F